MAENLSSLLGKTFKGTTISDPILEPYFIIRYEDGGWGVALKRTDYAGNTKFRVVSYPSNFENCVNKVIQEKIHEGVQDFKSLREYVESYRAVTKEMSEVFSKVLTG